MTTYTGDDNANTLIGGAGNDRFIGRGGNDVLTGGGGSDVFVYDARNFGRDTITDFGADDRIDVSGLGVSDLASLLPFMQQVGADVVISLVYDGTTESITLKNVSLDDLTSTRFVFASSTAPRTVSGTAYGDVLFGGRGSDTVSGGAGNDSLAGGAGNDKLIGGAGDDWLMGGTGADTFVYNAREFGRDTVADFGAGDKIDVSGLGVSDLASLTPFMKQVGQDVVITLGYDGSAESITIRNTTVESLPYTRFIFNASTTAKTVTGTAYSDVLFGGKGSDTVSGGAGNDSLAGGAGNDKLIGGAGDDWLMGGTGADTFVYNAREFGRDTVADFGAGDKIDVSGLGVSDLASLTPFMKQVGQDVVITLGYDGSAESITIRNTTVESLPYTRFIFNASTTAKTVTGTAYSDVLFGGKGSDTVSGGAGNDSLAGGAGSDKLIGGAGDDWLMGGSGSDTFVYDAREFGRDTIADFGAGDRIDVSGLGISDLASLTPFMKQVGQDVVITLGYDGSSESITVRNVLLDDLTATRFIFRASTTAQTVDGTSYSDVLFGGKGADTISGGAGNDTLLGGAGNDRLIGGTGDDRMTGGSGSDTFVFDRAPSSAGDDVITDFTRGVDKLEIYASAFGGGLVAGGTVDLVSGSNPSSVGHSGGVFLYNTTSGNLYYDADGQGGGAAELFLQLANRPTLSASDFIISG